MLELVYPIDSEAPRLPSMSASSRSGKGKGGILAEEMFPVVEPGGVVVGRASRSWCHSGSHLLHPVVHLHIINREEKLYLQKRSASKDIMPLRWDTAVGGHVIYGESILEALHREAFEELHFSEFNPIYMGTYQWNTERDSELVNIFATVGAFPSLTPDGDEVEQGRWWTMSEIDSAMGSGALTPNFESEFLQLRGPLLALL